MNSACPLRSLHPCFLSICHLIQLLVCFHSSTVVYSIWFQPKERKKNTLAFYKQTTWTNMGKLNSTRVTVTLHYTEPYVFLSRCHKELIRKYGPARAGHKPITLFFLYFIFGKTPRTDVVTHTWMYLYKYTYQEIASLTVYDQQIYISSNIKSCNWSTLLLILQTFLLKQPQYVC